MLLLRGATSLPISSLPPILFQYMLLLRGANRRGKVRECTTRFNTCSSCEEQFDVVCSAAGRTRFNTCSSCEEQAFLYQGKSSSSVSIHAPLARSNMRIHQAFSQTLFQYMLLLRGASDCPCKVESSINVSIHAPLARSKRGPRRTQKIYRSFNTCSSCEEQVHARKTPSGLTKFQYMLLLRGAMGGGR